jgi:uncharacterized protein YutE (UPF0331/DUF86 family)
MKYEPFERTSVSALNEFLYKTNIIDESVYGKIKRLINKRNEFVHRRSVESYSDDPNKIDEVLKGSWEALNALWNEIKKIRRQSSP